MRTGFWTERTVAWYARANDRSDYADVVLGVVPDLLEGCRSALDVGAGFGALALPLARKLPRVTAVEPAPAMARALRQAAAGEGLAHLAMIEAPWRAGLVPPHDLVACAFVSDLLRAGAPFLADAPTLARRRVLLVRDAPGGQDKFFFGELYPLLLGRPYAQRPPDHQGTVDALRALGVRPEVHLVEYSSDQPFDSLDEACDFWMTYMDLQGEAPRAVLRDFLGRRLVREGPRWIAPYRKRAAVITWAPGKPAVDGPG